MTRKNLKVRVAGAGGLHLDLPAGVAFVTSAEYARRDVISSIFLRFLLRKGQDSGLFVLMLSRPGQKKKTEGLQYQKLEKPCFVIRVS